MFCSVSVAYAPDCVHELFLRLLLLLLVFCLFVCLFFFKRNFFLRYVNTTYIHRGSLNWKQLPLGGMTFFVKGDKKKDGVLPQTLKSSCLINSESQRSRDSEYCRFLHNWDLEIRDEKNRR